MYVGAIVIKMRLQALRFDVSGLIHKFKETIVAKFYITFNYRLFSSKRRWSYIKYYHVHVLLRMCVFLK
jgi:hypothetical protein